MQFLSQDSPSEEVKRAQLLGIVQSAFLNKEGQRRRQNSETGSWERTHIVLCI